MTTKEADSDGIGVTAMLTVKQVAERLGVSLSLVYALCADGKLETSRFGVGRGTIRIAERCLLDYLERSRAVPRRNPVADLRFIRLKG